MTYIPVLLLVCYNIVVFPAGGPSDVPNTNKPKAPEFKSYEDEFEFEKQRIKVRMKPGMAMYELLGVNRRRLCGWVRECWGNMSTGAYVSAEQ